MTVGCAGTALLSLGKSACCMCMRLSFLNSSVAFLDFGEVGRYLLPAADVLGPLIFPSASRMRIWYFAMVWLYLSFRFWATAFCQ